jgi:hypothetical protein
VKKPRRPEPIANATGQKVPGAGGARRPQNVKDTVEEMETQRDRTLDVPQAGGEEPW